MVSEKFYTIVVGIGPGTGRAVAIRFSKEYPVVLLARKPESYENTVAHITKAGGRAIGIAADATNKDSLKKAFETVEKELPGSKLAAAVYNVRPDARKIGGFGPFLERTLEQLDTTLNGEVRGLFTFAQEVVPRLLDAVGSSPYPPTLLVSGATASLRGSVNWSAIAPAKSASRILAQSIAREFGPKGVHVAHAVLDGGIDVPTDENAGSNDATPDGKISPYGIAEAYFNLHTQHKSAWTQEIDLRPFNEKF